MLGYESKQQVVLEGDIYFLKLNRALQPCKRVYVPV